MNNMYKSYTLKEVSEKTNIPPSTIRRWEDVYSIKIERNLNNARRYKDSDIDILREIRSMRDRDIPKPIIIETLSSMTETNIEVETRKDKINKEIRYIESLFDAYPEIEGMIKAKYKNEVLYEDLKNDLKDELLSAVRVEISSGLKSFADAHKSEINRRDELLNENMRLRNGVKKEKKSSFFSVFG